MQRFLIEIFVRGAVLCLLTAIALGLLRRSAAAYRHLMCVLALCGLLILPLAQRLMPPLPLLPPQPAATPQRATAPTEEADPLSVGKLSSRIPPSPQAPQLTMIEAKPATPLAPDDTLLSPNMAVVRAAPHQALSRNVTAILLTIWGAGALTLLIRLMVALVRLRGLEAQSREAMWGSVAIRVGEQVHTPLTWGIRRNVILLPAALLSGDPSACESALRHEQAHVARRDWIWNLLAEIVCAFCWFQPGAWWLRRRMRLESERACDDLVLLSGVAGPDYAAHLLEIVRSVCNNEVAPAMAHSGGMEERMQHILDATKSRRVKLAWLAATAPFAVALLLLSALRVSARPAKDAPEAERLFSGVRSGSSNISSRPTNVPFASPDFSTPHMSELPPPARPLLFLDRAKASVGNFENSLKASKQDLAKYSTPQEKPLQAVPLPMREIVWGMAVDGLQPGFWLTQPISPKTPKIPVKSLVTYRILVRNTTNKRNDFMVQVVQYESFDAPYLIPNDSIGEALDGREVPEKFRAMCAPHNAIGVDAAYVVTLAPNEAVLLDPVPGPYGLRLGDTGREGYPSIANPREGVNWIVQPVTIHSLTPAEVSYARASPIRVGLTIARHDGTASQRSVALFPARNGGKRLYAKIQLTIGTRDAKAIPNADKTVWGKADKGLQCGIRLLNLKHTLQIGDTLEAELLWRNTSSIPIQAPLPRTLDLYPLIHDSEGHSLAIDFGARFRIFPGSHTFEPGEVRSLGVTAITLVARETPSPKNNLEPGHINLSPGAYKLSGLGGVGPPDPESGVVEFRLVGDRTEPSKKEGICWGETVRGFQLGARIVHEESVFKIGDTIAFQAFGRNLSGKDTDLTIGNYWKVNYKIQVQTRDGHPIYMKRDMHNQEYLVAGYQAEPFGNGATQEISKAMLKIARQPWTRKPGRIQEDEDAWVEAVPLRPGPYRVRLLSWGVFGTNKSEPASGWIPIEVKRA